MHLALSPDGVSSVTPATYREPLCRRRVLPAIRVTSGVTSESITPPSKLLRAHAPDHVPPTFISLPPAVGLCRLSQVPAGKCPFPALSPQIFPRMPGPLPRLSKWCTYSFLPTWRRPSPIPKWVGTWQELPQNDFMRAFDFEAAGISLCSGLRVCSPSRSFRPWNIPSTPGRHGFYVHAYLGLLPPRAVDMLTVRIEQLTVEGLTPSKICGLAGRS